MAAARARAACKASLLSLVLGGGGAAADLLESMREAFQGRPGLYVSVAVGGGPTQADVSASLLRHDVPLALYRSADTLPFREQVTIADDRGVIYDPDAPPAIACAYPTDGFTYNRTNSSGGHDFCGLSPGYPDSGHCTMPVSKYVEDYYFKDTVLGHWVLFRDTCHYDDTDEALEAQRAVWLNLTATSPLKYMSRTNIRPYNEVILKKQAGIAAYFWAHGGGFRAPTRDDTMACCLKQQYDCSNPKAAGSKPLFEFAGMYINWAVTAKVQPPAYGRMQAYRSAMQRSPPGWTAAEFLREMDPATICALDCSAQEEKVCSA